MSTLARLEAAIRGIGTGQLVVITGAGISAPSGLPTFRGKDPEAIWARDVTEVATRAFFENDPVEWWRWFRDRFAGILDAEPNEAHRAVVDLERWHVARGGAFALVTQNVDTLHEDAGSERIAKVHGTADRFRCSREGCPRGAPSGSLAPEEADFSRFDDSRSLETIPRCPACGALVRAHALMFDEYYTEHDDYRFAAADEAIGRAALLLFIGTSFSVGITELALSSARDSGAAMFSIDPVSRPPHGVDPIAGEAEIVLPLLVARLRG